MTFLVVSARPSPTVGKDGRPVTGMSAPRGSEYGGERDVEQSELPTGTKLRLRFLSTWGRA